MILEIDPETRRTVARIDASLYKDSDCLRYVFFKLVQGYTPASQVTGGVKDTKDLPMEYGTAFHKGLQARAQGKSFDEQLRAVTDHFTQPSIVVPENEWRNIGHLVATYVAYDTYYKSHSDLLIPKHAELRFAYPFYKTEKTEIVLCGTIDLVAEYCGRLVISDTKTTSVWNSDQYLAEYDLSPQLMIYKWVYDKLNGTDVGCMINGIFISKTKFATFKRSEVMSFSQEQIGYMITNLELFATQLAALIEIDHPESFIPNYNCCIKRYGEKAIVCPFAILCKQPTLKEGLELAEALFSRKVYNPMLFQT